VYTLLSIINFIVLKSAQVGNSDLVKVQSVAVSMRLGTFSWDGKMQGNRQNVAKMKVQMPWCNGETES
jgi:hypothetical protein